VFRGGYAIVKSRSRRDINFVTRRTSLKIRTLGDKYAFVEVSLHGLTPLLQGTCKTRREGAVTKMY
jgi:hypothetical protein